MAKASWDSCLLKNKQGAYLPCLRNAVAILTHRKEWHNVLAFDAFAGVVVKKKSPPWTEDVAPERDSLADWSREDSMRTACWIADEYNCPVPTHIVDEAVQVVAARWEVHPVRDYLNALAWDRKARIDDFLVRVAGAPDTPYIRAVTKNFFLSAVARTMKPGEQVDTVLILEGAQGLGKSTMLRLLASDAWFLDTTFNIGSKDGYQVLRNKWIVEFSELDSLNHAELSRAKAFISSVKDTYRQSYGRTATDFLRQCVFAGTVNPNGAGYLNDPTGARRFWPVTLTEHVDFKTVRAERNQLWAEALCRYRKCEPWHLRDPKLLKAAAEEAEERRERHPWEFHFRNWLQEHDRTRRGVSIEELLTKAVDMKRDMQDRGAQTKAGKALRAIGWTAVARGADDVRRYLPAENKTDPSKNTPNSTSNPPTSIMGSRRPKRVAKKSTR
jgi:putative DNA primase/helicase